MNRGRPKTLKDPFKVLLTLDNETIRALDYFQRISGVSRSQIIRIAIDRFLSGDDNRGGANNGKE